MKLYELCDEILRLHNAAYDAEDDEFERIKAEFGDAKIALGEKLDNIARLISAMDADCLAIEAESMRLNQRRKALERRAESLKFYVGNCLGQGNAYKTTLFSFTWRKSTSVEITGEVPEQYTRSKVVTEPDKKQINEDIRAGATLDFAKLVETQRLYIK